MSQNLVLHSDTDVSMWGCHLLLENKVEPIYFTELHYLDLKTLIYALTNDSDFALIFQSESPSVMQVHVCAGCDYLSIFYGFGNVLFWQQYLSTVNLFAHTETALNLFAHTETALGILANRTNSTFIFQIIGCAQLRYHKSL